MRISDLYFYLKFTLLGICIMQSSLFNFLNAYLKITLKFNKLWDNNLKLYENYLMLGTFQHLVKK